MTCHWQYFFKAAVDPVQLSKSGRSIGGVQLLGSTIGCAAVAAMEYVLSGFGSRPRAVAAPMNSE